MKFHSMLILLCISGTYGHDGGKLRGSSRRLKTNPIMIPFQSDFLLGRGVDVLTGETKFNNFDFGESFNQDNYNQRSQFLSTSTAAEVKDTTETLAKASGSAFGVKASGSVEWATTQNVKVEATNLIASTIVQTHMERIPARSVTNVDQALLDDLQRFKDEGNLEAFVEKYGTHYISGIQYGGSAMSLIQITSESRELKDELAGEVTASFKKVGFEGSAEFKQKMASVSSDSRNTISSDLFLQGAPVSGLGSSDIDKVLEAFATFGEQLDNRAGSPDRQPFPLNALVEPWENIDEIRSILGDAPLLPRTSATTIDLLSSSYRAMKYLEQIAFDLRTFPAVRGTDSRYVAGREVLNDRASKIDADLKLIAGLSYFDLKDLDPFTLEFERKYLNAPNYEIELNHLADGKMWVQWSFEPSANVDQDRLFGINEGKGSVTIGNGGVFTSSKRDIFLLGGDEQFNMGSVLRGGDLLQATLQQNPDGTFPQTGAAVGKRFEESSFEYEGGVFTIFFA